ncbi:hypothetical protein B0J13DRAFT_519479 [Dactylonectria estremocensis]|uniref:Uncharacterized protein n=1 Tax=Dactylonectria estremocensis TaxID=1079267 RepID=A0A9P9FFC4_9HYPO|nr:hypothetical protein B0J13DRAFT_519479 [Dactylonectria estremocensis]
MSTFDSKIEVPTSNFEVDSEDLRLDSKIHMYGLANSVRLALTALALAAGITILGVSADAVAVYNATHVPDDYLLPLWPSNMDLRPTVALVAGGAIVVVANAISLLANKAQVVKSHSGMHTALVFVAPAIGFIAAMIAMCFFYAINTSTTADSFQSWTCRWKDVTMMTKPHFGTLCKQSKAGLGLSVLLVPLEAVILGVAGYQASLQRQLNQDARGPERKAGSPAMS